MRADGSSSRSEVEKGPQRLLGQSSMPGGEKWFRCLYAGMGSRLIWGISRVAWPVSLDNYICCLFTVSDLNLEGFWVVFLGKKYWLCKCNLNKYPVLQDAALHPFFGMSRSPVFSTHTWKKWPDLNRLPWHLQYIADHAHRHQSSCFGACCVTMHNVRVTWFTGYNNVQKIDADTVFISILKGNHSYF